MEELKSVLNQTLISIGIACITFLGAYATVYIKKCTDKLILETEKIKDDQSRELVIEALYRLDDVAEKTVSAIEQTTASVLRNNFNLDKKIKKEELEKLAVGAYNKIVMTLEPEYVRVLNDSLGDFKGYVENTIEDKVRQLKEQQKV